MVPEQAAIANAYLDHLTSEDLVLLVPGGSDALRAGHGQVVQHLRPEGLEELLASPRVFDAVFATAGEADTLVGASPFLVFAVAVHRAAIELNATSYVSEWLGLGRRAPVFDAAQLRDFLAAPWRRLFLAELLASYTHVASGSVLVSTRRGWRRQRFSELDPVRLAGLLEVISESERPGILRRLGDLSLFLTGVFPDYVASRGFGPIEESRLLRSGVMVNSRRSPSSELKRMGVGGGAVGLLEQLGRRWYRAAFDALPRPVPGNVAVLGELPDRFGDARRILSFVTERFLFRHRDHWFELGGG
jgi:hypothetical protein